MIPKLNCSRSHPQTKKLFISYGDVWVLCKQAHEKLPTERERQSTWAHANQTTGLSNGRDGNWTPEVAFSLFRALSRHQLTFPF